MRQLLAASVVLLATSVLPQSLPAAPDANPQPQPEFPAALRRAGPIADINQAVVYTIDEPIYSEANLETARQTGSDVLVRAWFKWAGNRDYAKSAPLIAKAHAMGALFGGGVTCSALFYGRELTEQQVDDMATRGPEGQLINAWNRANRRHGTLSNPAYLEYILASCKKQIDAGADCLFMDELKAALGPNEGFDDYSNDDFRKYLLDRYGKQGWEQGDKRWRDVFKIDLGDRNVAPDGTMGTFRYREYLKSLGLGAHPHAARNPLDAVWVGFRVERDHRAWKWLADAIRAYAAAQGRRVLLSGNGLTSYVDFQTLGVWDRWLTTDERVDLRENQIYEWASVVSAGWEYVGKKIPVVFFHDWGDYFPWMQVPAEDRRLWLRVRAPEIYAAGGFFAFPVHGPARNNARQDETLAEVIRQSAFYHQYKDLYLKAKLWGFEPLETTEPALSLALWRRESPPGLILHVINRQIEGTNLKRRTAVAVHLPTDRPPKAVRVVSPDWQGEKPGEIRTTDGRVTIVLPEFESYSVAILDYDAAPELKPAVRRICPYSAYARVCWGEFDLKPGEQTFVVEPDGRIQNQKALPGMLSGAADKNLGTPLKFEVNMPHGGLLRFNVRAVARSGAKLHWQIDGRVEKTIDLPDRDGQSEVLVREYNQTYELAIPPGRHHATLDNVGKDWLAVGWYSFVGDGQARYARQISHSFQP